MAKNAFLSCHVKKLFAYNIVEKYSMLQLLQVLIARLTCSEDTEEAVPVQNDSNAEVAEEEQQSCSPPSWTTSVLSDDANICQIENLAILYENQGKYDEALPLYKQCLELRRVVLGNYHTETLRTVRCLNTLCSKLDLDHVDFDLDVRCFGFLPVEKYVVPNELKQGYFPKLGVSISFLRAFVESLCLSVSSDMQQDINLTGRAVIAELTTTEVCEWVAKPSTAKYKMSLCDLLHQSQTPGVGEATIFVSHAWKYKFVDVVNALENHFETALDTIVWFDVFSVNQHSTSNKKDFDWWSSTFQEAIRKFGRTVMVLSPWRDPVPFTRAWCLWELYCTVITDCKFEVALSSRDRQEFFKEIDSRSLNDMKAKIDVSRSECFVAKDKALIMTAIAKQTTCNELNKRVFQEIQNWMTCVLEGEVANLSQSEIFEDENITHIQNVSKITLIENLAILYDNQGKYAKALPLYVECLKMKKLVLGEYHPNTLAAMNNLAVLYENQGKYDKALPLYEDSWNMKKMVLGDNHPYTLMSMNNLASLYDAQGKYDKALPLYEECLVMMMTALGDIHPSTLTCINNLAILYGNLGKYDEALSLLNECWKTQTTVLGDNHPDTLASMNWLAFFLESQGKYDKALLLYEECTQIQRTVLGDNHPNTLNTLSALNRLRARINE